MKLWHKTPTQALVAALFFGVFGAGFAYALLPNILETLASGSIDVGMMRRRTEIPNVWLWRRTYLAESDPVLYYAHLAQRAALFVGPLLLALGFWVLAFALLLGQRARLHQPLVRASLFVLYAGSAVMLYWLLMLFAISYVAFASSLSGA